MNTTLTLDVAWRPVVPSHYLRSSANIVAGFTQGQELAIWRNGDGVVQVWENRCPHRGTRLTLGRILNDRLSCAYHGWEFGANGGKCTVIPAHPKAPAPKQLCVKTFSAAEFDGMVWVSLEQSSLPPEGEGDERAPPCRTFVRTLGLRAPFPEAMCVLLAHGWKALSSHVLQGQFVGQTVTLFMTDATDELSFAHIWTEASEAAILLPVFRAAESVRNLVEAQSSLRS